jgi:hypothetical protein
MELSSIPKYVFCLIKDTEKFTSPLPLSTLCKERITKDGFLTIGLQWRHIRDIKVKLTTFLTSVLRLGSQKPNASIVFTSVALH